MALPSYATPAERATSLALRVYGVLICIYLVGPILIFVPLSFSEQALFSYPIHSFGLRWYRALFASTDWSRAFANSLFVALLSSLLATSLGVLAAVGLWRARFPGKDLILVVLLTPMVVPSVVAAVSMYFAFAPFGLNNSYAGLVLSHSVISAPLVVVTVMATLSRFDATLLRAASSLGAGPFSAFRYVMLPLILPGVVTGAIFAFALSFDEVVVTLFIAGPVQRTLPVQMYLATSDVLELTITAAATLMFVIAVGLMLAFEFLKRTDRLAQNANMGSAATDGAR